MPRYSDAIEEARKRRRWLEQMQVKLRKEADELEPIIAGLMAEEQMLARLDDEESTAALTPEHRHNTLDPVNPAISSNALRSQARMADDVKKHRLVAALEKKGLTLADVADALEKRLKPRTFPRSTVQSWVKPKESASYRAIPQDAAEALKAMYGVPLSAWPRIIPG
jgi:hypothetical protein